MKSTFFSNVANFFPTERIATDKSLAALWRVLFYVLRPRKPFIMRTQFYRLFVHPKRGTLTRALIRRGHWEPKETSVFVTYLRKGGFVIDAGANFGHYSLVSSGVVGADGLVIAFEPDPFTYTLLTENTSLLSNRNVICEQAGLGAENAEMTLALDAENPGGHSFSVANVRQHASSIRVPVFALDNYLNEKEMTRRLDLIKIDVQGFEWKLISGARRTIERDRPVIFCEVTPLSMKNVNDDFHDLLAFFREHHYRVAWIAPNGFSELTYESAAALLGEPNCEYADMVFLP